MTNQNDGLLKEMQLALCRVEIPHLKGFSIDDYYRAYPEFMARISDLAKAALAVIQPEIDKRDKLINGMDSVISQMLQLITDIKAATEGR